jgi:molybdate transport system regulatory protein
MRLRVVCGAEDAFGPGKAQLLHELHQTGSLVQAAKAMKMSYMKAWTLVKAMNKHFVEPLVVLSRGGTHGGGARLTSTGEEVLLAYKRLRTKAEAAAKGKPWKRIKSLLKD